MAVHYKHDNFLVSAHRNLKTALFCTVVNYSGYKPKKEVNFIVLEYFLWCNYNKYANEVSEKCEKF